MKRLAEAIKKNEAGDSAELILLKDIAELGKQAADLGRKNSFGGNAVPQAEWKDMLVQLDNIIGRLKKYT